MSFPNHLGCLLTLFASIPCLAQSTASISGKVLDERGEPVSSSVIAVIGGRTFQELTGNGGTFALSNIPIGTAVLCAKPTQPQWADPLIKGSSSSDVFLDSCQSVASPVRLDLVKGQSYTAVITLKRGRRFEVRLSDPQKLLPVSSKDPKQDIYVFVTEANGLINRLPVSGSDANGRSHAMVLPYDTQFSLTIIAESHSLQDEKSSDLTKAPTIFSIPKGGPNSDRVITLVGRKTAQ